MSADGRQFHDATHPPFLCLTFSFFRELSRRVSVVARWPSADRRSLLSLSSFVLIAFICLAISLPAFVSLTHNINMFFDK